MSKQSAKREQIIQGATGDWEIVVGLEVHAQVSSNAKLFSGAPTTFGAGPNENVSLVDAAMPGMLPVINKYCVEQAIRTGLGINAQINLKSVFDRKNYFYPDLPAGYQISQYKDPIVGEGQISVDLSNGETVEIGIERLHLEQDAGKSTHEGDHSLVDLNRAGVALMEIVSKPDIRSSEEAAAYVQKLRAILRYLGTCDGNMEEGSMRADVNVSVRKPGDPYGTRCEIKNVNSIRFVAAAIDYEAQRQVDLIEDGGEVDQETRLFDPNTGKTRTMRSKEDAHDYRYFPDPDLLPLEFDQSVVDEIARTLPELPDQKKTRFIDEFGLSAYDAGVLVSEKEIADYFEEATSKRDPKMVANWITGELFAALNKSGQELADCKVSASQLGELVDLIADETISGRIAKQVFEIMFENGGNPGEIVEKQGLKQVTDTSEIEAIVDKVIADNPDKAEEVKTKPKAVGWFVGQVMQASGGKANPKAVNEILKRKLES